jgi:hypothetical protein
MESAVRAEPVRAEQAPAPLSPPSVVPGASGISGGLGRACYQGPISRSQPVDGCHIDPATCLGAHSSGLQPNINAGPANHPEGSAGCKCKICKMTEQHQLANLSEARASYQVSDAFDCAGQDPVQSRGGVCH